MRALKAFICALCVAGFGFSTSGLAAEKVRVAIAHKILWTTGVSMIVADQQEFFKAEGLDVDMTFIRAVPEAVQSMIVGEIDMGIGLGIMSLMGAYEKGAPMRVVGAEMTGSTYYWYAKQSAPFNSVKEAAGKKLGHNQPGSAAHLSSAALKEWAGTDIQLVVAGRMGANLTQVLSGQIDIGYAVPPVALDKIEKGELKIVARGADVPALRDLTLRVNIAHADFLKDNRETVAKLLRARWRAIEWLYDNPGEAARFYAEINKISESTARLGISFYPKAFVRPAPIKRFDEAQRLALKHKFISKRFTDAQIKEFIDIVYDGTN